MIPVDYELAEKPSVCILTVDVGGATLEEIRVDVSPREIVVTHEPQDRDARAWRLRVPLAPVVLPGSAHAMLRNNVLEVACPNGLPYPAHRVTTGAADTHVSHNVSP